MKAQQREDVSPNPTPPRQANNTTAQLKVSTDTAKLMNACSTAGQHLLLLLSARNSLGHPCFSCLGRSWHSVLYQNTARSLPVSIGRVGNTQPNRRCRRPKQPLLLRCELGRAHTAAVTACSKSLRASMVALVKDQVNIICRTWQGQQGTKGCTSVGSRQAAGTPMRCSWGRVPRRSKRRSAALRQLQRLSAVGCA